MTALRELSRRTVEIDLRSSTTLEMKMRRKRSEMTRRILMMIMNGTKRRRNLTLEKVMNRPKMTRNPDTHIHPLNYT